jgi:hypothetical protein
LAVARGKKLNEIVSTDRYLAMFGYENLGQYWTININSQMPVLNR